MNESIRSLLTQEVSRSKHKTMLHEVLLTLLCNAYVNVMPVCRHLLLVKMAVMEENKVALKFC